MTETSTPRSPDQWRPIHEAPRDGTRVDLYIPERGRIPDAYWVQDAEAATLQRLGHAWSTDRGVVSEGGSATHWRSCPPPPGREPAPHFIREYANLVQVLDAVAQPWMNDDGEGGLPEAIRQMAADAYRVESMQPVVEAARSIQHWHDSGEDGMVVSAEHVQALWQALADLDTSEPG
ncbi:hypothetical protein [Thioalkalivibrio sp. ALE16]|uniref:hypothetical protein n=1 Tax=Thioalkalivibrio sp. ALE16 TaxID=1158172 RepID=UPI0012DE30CE|nr:hypothetical protein [Thioalkalivibrio sp. ALE16]